jgi:hypothetical protein
MTPAQAAHLRLLSLGLPTRHHEQPQGPRRQGVKRGVGAQKRRAIEMHSSGRARKEIMRDTGLSRRTLERLLGRGRV